MRQHVKFTEPPEPTNVQWENKQLSKNDVKNNIIQSTYLLLLIALIGFFGIGELSKNALSAEMQFPLIACD
jgi:hypothetical protein